MTKYRFLPTLLAAVLLAALPLAAQSVQALDQKGDTNCYLGQK